RLRCICASSLAGGHWFEPSTAHFARCTNRACPGVAPAITVHVDKYVLNAAKSRHARLRTAGLVQRADEPWAPDRDATHGAMPRSAWLRGSDVTQRPEGRFP